MNGSAVAPWIVAQVTTLLAQNGHAWLLAGPSGMGQYSLALALARAWLCDQPSALGACNQCASCHAVDVRTHADLYVLMPETAMLALGWPLGEGAQTEIDDKKRKASKEIRIEAMRDAVEFCQRTGARARGKAILVFPAERMNAVAANALLKTLEEPAGDVRFVMASEAAHQLMPTIRSRCLTHAMAWPRPQAALAWLQAQGVDPAQAQVMLRAAGGRAQDALEFYQAGSSAQLWVDLPKAMARGDLSLLKDWSPAQTVDALQKICHDVLALKTGAAPRFFAAVDLPAGGDLTGLTQWSRALSATRRTVEHPFNMGLMIEALVSQAKNALNSTH
ncbi:MAG: DNA polymerase III subunit delta' [Rhodoferax sp.]